MHYHYYDHYCYHHLNLHYLCREVDLVRRRDRRRRDSRDGRNPETTTKHVESNRVELVEYRQVADRSTEQFVNFKLNNKDEKMIKMTHEKSKKEVSEEGYIYIYIHVDKYMRGEESKRKEEKERKLESKVI